MSGCIIASWLYEQIKMNDPLIHDSAEDIIKLEPIAYNKSTTANYLPESKVPSIPVKKSDSLYLVDPQKVNFSFGAIKFQ
jgi:hypothetical protein